MSHELRTPLNAIIGFSEMLQSESFGPLGDPHYHEYAGLIRQAGAHLLDVITSILDPRRIEACKLVLQPDRLTLVEIGRASVRERVCREGRCGWCTET